MKNLIFIVVIAFSFLELKSQSDQNTDKGTMLIIGAFSKDDVFLEKFADLIGNKDSLVVIIPTAQPQVVLSRDSGFVDLKTRFYNIGFKNVSVLHTLDKNVANRDSTVQQLKNAKGVFFTGAGGTGALIQAYLNTKVQEEVKNVYERGGVIGGSSGGALIFGEYLDTKVRSKNSFTTFENTGELKPSLNFLSGTVIEVHLFEDNRQHSLEKVVKKNPDVLGIGIDIETGIVVKNNILEVVGMHYAAIYDSSYKDQFMVLQKGDRYHIRERRLMKPNEGRDEINMPEAELKEYIGSYAGGNGNVMYIKMNEGKLYITESKSTGRADIFVERKDVLFVKIVNAQFVFERNEYNEIKRMVIEPEGLIFDKIE